jgi:MOSC domain-containing protein YiiM
VSGRTAADLERAWGALAGAPVRSGAVRLITLRLGDGRHELPARALVSPELGVHGDRWAKGRRPNPDAQVTMMDVRVAELLADGDRALLDAPGDNLLVDLDLGEQALPAGSRLRIGGALLEVTILPHTGCKKFRQRLGAAALEWVNEAPNRARRLRGINCRVVAAGEVAVGDRVVPA